MDILAEIVTQRRKRVESAKTAVPLAEVIAGANKQRQLSDPHRLRQALSADRVNIIAEFKRRSPSKGIIKAAATPALMAQNYEVGGAAAMSVLTEPDFFNGSVADLTDVKQSSSLPVLRKDFVFDAYQVYESALIGADAVLLIVATLDDPALVKLRRLIEDELAMDALVEVHDEVEMRRATDAGATLVGVNNRDLKTFSVSLETSTKLARVADSGTILVSESGISTSADIQLLRNAGYKGFLIGESLMRSDNPAAALNELTRC
jgi:indole-3-glycerol phosphate synthase